LRVCGERPRKRRTAERGNELPSADAHCHFPRPNGIMPRGDMDKNITPQSAGL
jgi:hypothetical protein